jgi:cytochrome c biogenesis protein CcdA
MTLSALSGSVIGGATLGLAYVFGMVFPLLVMALLWDRYQLGERRFLQARPVTLSLPRGRRIHTNTINVGVAIAFAVMGLFVLNLANSGTMTGGPGFQVVIGSSLAAVFKQIEIWTAPIPEPVLGAALLGLAGVFIWGTLHRLPTPADHVDPVPLPGNPSYGTEVRDVPPASCHQPERAPGSCHDTTDTPVPPIKELLP